MKQMRVSEWLKNRKLDVMFLACCVIAVVMFLMFIFPDVIITTRHGITLWNALAEGRLKEFYLMNNDIIIANQFNSEGGSAIYDFPIYIVFAIWNLPLWIYEKITGLYALDTVVGLVWAKSISIPFFVGIQCCINKIGKLIKGEQFATTSSLKMTLTSAFFLLPILIMGQYDTMAILFMMLGVFNYIKGNTKLFIMWFAISLPFKMFTLFVFIPLILLREKKVRNIIFQLFCGCSFLFFVKILQKLYFTSNGVTDDYMQGHFLPFIFQSQIGFGYGGASLFFVVFLSICMYCYFKRTPEKEKIGKWAIYVSFLGIASFMITALTHPQWSLLILPFLSLLVCCEDEGHRSNGLLIETILSYGLLIAAVYYYTWVFSIEVGRPMLAGKLFYDEEKSLIYSIKDLTSSVLPGIDMNYLVLAGSGIFVAGILFFIYWANPGIKREKFARTELTFNNIIGIRLLIMILLGLAMVFIMF